MTTNPFMQDGDENVLRVVEQVLEEPSLRASLQPDIEEIIALLAQAGFACGPTEWYLEAMAGTYPGFAAGLVAALWDNPDRQGLPSMCVRASVSINFSFDSRSTNLRKVTMVHSIDVETLHPKNGKSRYLVIPVAVALREPLLIGDDQRLAKDLREMASRQRKDIKGPARKVELTEMVEKLGERLAP